jgi:GcrA cell cycle regulator
MPVTEPTWTDERIQLLKRRFEEGLSCRTIAAEMGVSRNAVIGKLSRLDLRRQKRGNSQRQPRKKAAKRQGRATPRLQYHMLGAYYAPLETVTHEPIHNGRCCSLLELDEQRCRWPINTPGAADFCFCGNFPSEGLPYCAGHARLAYRLDPRQRVARE